MAPEQPGFARVSSVSVGSYQPKSALGLDHDQTRASIEHHGLALSGAAREGLGSDWQAGLGRRFAAEPETVTAFPEHRSPTSRHGTAG